MLGVTKLPAANPRTASSASARICSVDHPGTRGPEQGGPRLQQTGPPAGPGPVLPAIDRIRPRSASTRRPISAANDQASTATIGYPSIPRRPPATRTRWIVVTRPLPVGTGARAARHGGRPHRRPPERCSTPAPPRALPLSPGPVGGAGAAQDAAGIRPGSRRCSSAAGMRRNRWWSVGAYCPPVQRHYSTGSPRPGTARTAAESARLEHRLTAARASAPAPRSRVRNARCRREIRARNSNSR